MKKTLIYMIFLIFNFFFAFHCYGEDIKSIKLIFSDNAPAKAGGNVFFEQTWINKINSELEKVGYTLDITSYHASSLYKYPSQVRACEKGLIDMTTFIVSWEKTRAPLHTVLRLPMLGLTADDITPIWFDLQEQIPEFANEFSKYVELFHFAAAPAIFNMNKIRRVPNDFKGAKVSATGVMADLFKSIGASPFRIDAIDWYSSMDRGLVEVLPVGTAIVAMFKLHEVTRIHVIPTDDSLTLTCATYIMNRKTFDNLPPEVQKVIINNSRSMSKEMTDFEIKNNISQEKMLEDKGNTVIRLTQKEMHSWRAAAKPVHENWLKEMEDLGLPGQKVLNETNRLIKSYQ